MEAIRNFDELVAHLAQRTRRTRVAVVCPYDHSTQGAVEMALQAGIADVVLVGQDDRMQQVGCQWPDRVSRVSATDDDDAARQAVALVREGHADVLMKGLLNTDNLLHAVLNKETGILPRGHVLTHLTCAQIPQYERLLFFSDAAVIPYPTKEQRAEQLRYLLDICRQTGIAEPRVSLINCSEKVNAKFFPFTVEYQELIAQTREGLFGPCIVDGPLDLKTSLSPATLAKKGISSPLEGRADALVFPDIQAANVFYKTITLFCSALTAGILRGPQVPVVLPSRGDSPECKFYSLAMAAL